MLLGLTVQRRFSAKVAACLADKMSRPALKIISHGSANRFGAAFGAGSGSAGLGDRAQSITRKEMRKTITYNHTFTAKLFERVDGMRYRKRSAAPGVDHYPICAAHEPAQVARQPGVLR